jgi:HipA-like C-terminal domain/HipA N-terminal domain
MSELIVYLSGRRAGRLIRKDNGNLQFRYDPAYAGPVISQALPVQQDASERATTQASRREAARHAATRAAPTTARRQSQGGNPPVSRRSPAEAAGHYRERRGRSAPERSRRDHAHHQARALALLQPRRQRGLLHGFGVETVELLRNCSSVPAQDLPTFWRALVFNWLIGNCDAHAKNYSLLYDRSAPTLAPLYDLVSTTAYPELTTRLAMSIDGATQISDVNTKAWGNPRQGSRLQHSLHPYHDELHDRTHRQ